MLDRDSVIDGLDEITHYDGDQMFYNDIFIRGIADDARTLLKEQEEQIKNRDESLEKAREEIKWLRGMLKEQEAVEPYGMNAERTYGICPKCGKIVFRYGNVEENHYCGICGQEVKWE